MDQGQLDDLFEVSTSEASGSEQGSGDDLESPFQLQHQIIENDSSPEPPARKRSRYASVRDDERIQEAHRRLQAALVEAELLPGGEEVAQSTSGQDDDLTNFQSQQGSEDGGQTSYDPMNQTHGHQRDNATLSAPTTSATALTATNEQADGSDTFSSAGNIDTLQENYEISADGIRMRENSVHDLLSSVQAFLEHRRLARNAANKAKQIIAQRIVAIHEALEAAGQPNPPTVPPTGTPTSHDGDDTPI